MQSLQSLISLTFNSKESVDDKKRKPQRHPLIKIIYLKTVRVMSATGRIIPVMMGRN